MSRTADLVNAWLAKAILALALFASGPSALAQPAVEPIEISARPITQFHIGREDKRFGPLEFVGGLELTSSSRDLGALSAIRFTSPVRILSGSPIPASGSSEPSSATPNCAPKA